MSNLNKITYPLHPTQQTVHNSTKRFRVVNCGRRWGKTHIAWVEVLVYLLQHPGALVWWVAPIYKELEPATRKVRDLTPATIIKKTYEMHGVIRYIQLFNGSECYFHSADREDSLRGMGLDGLVVDEAAQLKEQRWHGELEPSLMDKDGWAIFIGTPRGQNWFHKLYLQGQDADNDLYESWQFSSYDNAIENGGFIKQSSIDTIAADMPETLRRQEIFGVFLQGEGAVFRYIDRQTVPSADWKGESVFVGCDLAKTHDFTVLVALNENGVLLASDRFSELDWTFQRKRIRSFCERYNNAHLLLDSTGVGDPVYDELQREYLRVNGYKFTNQSKKELIENLSLMFDNGQVWLNKTDEHFTTLRGELEAYAYLLSPSGNIIYGAPEGFFDDCVTALALAAWQLKTLPHGNIQISFQHVKK